MSAVMQTAPVGTAAPADADDEINLLEYWQILRDRQWVVAGVTAAVFVLALVLTLLATPIFRASSTLQIERDTMKIMDVDVADEPERLAGADDEHRGGARARERRLDLDLVPARPEPVTVDDDVDEARAVGAAVDDPVADPDRHGHVDGR